MTQPHPIPGARFLDPAVLQRIDDLELVAKTVVSGVFNGLHRSADLFHTEAGWWPVLGLRHLG